MIIKREKYYIKHFKKDSYSKYKDGKQYLKRTSYWLFGIIPLYIKIEVQSGDYE